MMVLKRFNAAIEHERVALLLYTVHKHIQQPLQA